MTPSRRVHGGVLHERSRARRRAECCAGRCPTDRPAHDGLAIAARDGPVMAVATIVVIALAIPASSLFRLEVDLVNRSGGRITSVNFVSINGRTTFDIYAAAGISESAGLDLACSVVGPVLAQDGYGEASFFVLDRAGDVLATQSSRCAAPTPG